MTRDRLKSKEKYFLRKKILICFLIRTDDDTRDYFLPVPFYTLVATLPCAKSLDSNTYQE